LRISSLVTLQGPIGLNASNPFAMVRSPCELSALIHRCHPVARCQLQYPIAIARAADQAGATDHEHIGALLDEAREGSLKIEIANFRYYDLPPQYRRSFRQGLQRY
jgi:hypothetical protein